MTLFPKPSQQEIIKMISTASDSDIAKWIDQVIRQISVSIPYDFRSDISGPDIIGDIYHSTKSPAIKSKLWTGIAWIVNQVNWLEDDFAYLEALLGIITRLKSYNIQGPLLSLATRGILKKRRNTAGTSLHSFLIAALASIGYTDQLENVLLRDIHRPEYAALTFRILWTQNIKKALEVSYVIASHAVNASSPHFPTKYLFREFVDKNTLGATWSMFSSIINSNHLKQDAKFNFLKLVDDGELGFSLVKKDVNIKLMRLNSTFDDEYPIPMTDINWSVYEIILEYFSYKMLKIGRGKLPSEVNFSPFHSQVAVAAIG
jgi:hypothetical protein